MKYGKVQVWVDGGMTEEGTGVRIPGVFVKTIGQNPIRFMVSGMNCGRYFEEEHEAADIVLMMGKCPEDPNPPSRKDPPPLPSGTWHMIRDRETGDPPEAGFSAPFPGAVQAGTAPAPFTPAS